MEKGIFALLKQHIEDTEETRDFFYKFSDSPQSKTEAMFAEKIIKDSLNCFVAILSEKDLSKKADLLASLLISSMNVAHKRKVVNS